MVKRRMRVVVVAVALGALAASGVAAAAESESQRGPADRRAFCERLQEAAQDLRAKIGQIEALQERIEQKIESGELRPPQEARAKQALRKLEAWQEELEERLERMLEVYGEKCTR